MMAMMNTIVIVDTSGSALTLAAAWRANRVLTTTPSAIGTITTCTMSRNSDPVLMSIQVPASSDTSAGVASGAIRVETSAIDTPSATSPRARKVITFDAVPLGQQPTRITPTAMSGGRRSASASRYAMPGMIR